MKQRIEINLVDNKGIPTFLTTVDLNIVPRRKEVVIYRSQAYKVVEIRHFVSINAVSIYVKEI